MFVWHWVGALGGRSASVLMVGGSGRWGVWGRAPPSFFCRERGGCGEALMPPPPALGFGGGAALSCCRYWVPIQTLPYC